MPELEESEIGDGHSRRENLSSGSLDQSFYDRVAAAVGERIKQCGNRVPVITGTFSVLRRILDVL